MSIEVTERVSLGIQGMDQLTKGGIPKGLSTLLTGTSGTGKTVFGIEFVRRGIEEFGDPAVFVTCEETPAKITRWAQAFGWDFEAHQASGMLRYVNLALEPGSGVISVEGKFTLEPLIQRIRSVVEEIGARRVVVDSLGVLLAQFGNNPIARAELSRVFASLEALGVTSLITAERESEYGPVASLGMEEFASDSVLILRNPISGERRRRTVEVLKMRGCSHIKGEFPFTISSPRGIEALPISSMRLTSASSGIRCATGDEVLDEMCGGGYYRDSVILLSGATGCGKTLLATIFTDQGAKLGERVLFFGFEESREQLTRNAAGWGMNFEAWESRGLLRMICDYPEVSGLEEHLTNMQREIERYQPDRVVVDSLSALERIGSVRQFRDFTIGLTSHIKSLSIPVFMTSVSGALMGGPSVTEAHISTLTDTIILLRYIELSGQMSRGITVLKMRGSSHDKTIHEFAINETGIVIGSPFEGLVNFMSDGRGPTVDPGTGANVELFSEDY